MKIRIKETATMKNLIEEGLLSLDAEYEVIDISCVCATHVYTIRCNDGVPAELSSNQFEVVE